MEIDALLGALPWLLRCQTWLGAYRADRGKTQGYTESQLHQFTHNLPHPQST